MGPKLAIFINGTIVSEDLSTFMLWLNIPGCVSWNLESSQSQVSIQLSPRLSTMMDIMSNWATWKYDIFLD